MSDDEIRRILGDDRVSKGNEFDRGIESLQLKYSEYFENRDPNELSHYITIFDSPTEGKTTIDINTIIPSATAIDVMALFNSIYK